MRASDDFPLSFRFSQWKLQDYQARLANTPKELEQILIPISEAGVDIFHASQRRYWEPEFEGSGLNLSGWAKKVTGKPSITVGSVSLAKDTTETAVDLAKVKVTPIDKLVDRLDHQEFDLVAVGSALLADLNWPLKVKADCNNDIAPYSTQVLAELF